ncbi:MAG: DUF6569 family protein, partial [Halobacteriota archaeon]
MTGPAYNTLSEALQRGTLTITEISAQASVPTLLVVNNYGLPVLLPWRGLCGVPLHSFAAIIAKFRVFGNLHPAMNASLFPLS